MAVAASAADHAVPKLSSVLTLFLYNCDTHHTHSLEYEANQRPTAEDGRIWLQDLLAELDDDTEPLPALPVVENMPEPDNEEVRTCDSPTARH
jgi:hypothetical protein